MSCRPVCLTLYLWDVGCQQLASFLLIALLSDVSCTDRDREIQRNRQTEKRRGERDESLAQPCPGGGVCVFLFVRAHTNASGTYCQAG